MTGFAVLLRKDLREQWRTLRLPVVAIIFFVTGLGSPVLAKYTPELLKGAGGNIQITIPTPKMKDAIDQFVKNVGQIGSFAGILLAMSTIAREREQGTTALVLSKPVTRSAFLGSKFVALVVTLGLAVLTGSVAAYAYTTLLFARPPVLGFTACCSLILLGVVVFAAITFLASTVIGSTLPAAGVGLGAYILMAIISIDPRLGQFTPDGLIEPARALALSNTAPHLWISVLASLVWIVAMLVGSWLMFRNQEFGS